MPVINSSESDRIEKRKNRILYADFLTQQNDFANGLAPTPPVLKSQYGLYNQLTLGRLETTPAEQSARSVVLILPPPALSTSSITPSATNTSVTLSLPTSTSVTAYTYVVGNSAGVPLVPQPTVTGDAAATGQVTFSPLTPGTQYSVVVTSTGPSGTSVSAPLPIYTLPTPPSGFSATAPTTSGATISWSGGGGATSYDYIITDSTNNQIYPSTSLSSGIAIVDNGISGTATFTGLPAGSQYTITVTPRNPSGIPSSPPATFSINTAPAAPPAPTASGSTTDGFSIALTSSVGAASTKYSVDGVIVTTTSSPVRYDIIGNDVVFTGLTPGGHDVRVISVSATSVESNGTLATIYTRPVAPLSSTFSVASTSPSAFTLTWSGTTGATSYSYVIKANGVPIANPTITDNGAAGNAVFSNLSPGVTYSVEVIVRNPASPPNSATSSPVTAYTAPNAAVGITQTAGTATTATIAWTDAAGATNYLYTIKDASQATVGSATTATTLLGATITGLTAGKVYSVIVTARSANGSTPSSVAMVYTAPSAITSMSQTSSTSTSLTVGWSGGLGATSYVYSLNGVSVVPSTDNGLTTKDATFGGLTPGTVYTSITATAQVTLANGTILPSVGSTQSNSVVAPEAPTLSASATSITSTSFSLSFTPGTGAGAYTYSVYSGFSMTPMSTSSYTATYTASPSSVRFSGLAPGTDYYVIVTASLLDGNGISQESSTSKEGPFSTAAAPAAPTATNTPSNTITSKGVTVGFTPLAGMTYSYKVDGGTAAAITSLTPPATTPSYYLSPNPLVAGQPATVQFTGMSSGAGHSVSIVATDAGGTPSSPYVFPSTGTFNTLAAPSTPTATAAATFTQTAITLTLPTPSAGTTYSYSVSGGSPSVVLSPQPTPTISGNTYTFSGLTAGTPYTVAVTSTDAAGATSVYTTPSITTTSPPPVVPTKAATPVSSITSKGFTVNWNAVSGATSYTYSINTGGSSAQGPSQSTTSTNAEFSGLSPGTTYTIKVYSVGPGGTSTTSVDYSQTTLAGPTDIVFGTITSTTTTITVPFTGGTGPAGVLGNTITYTATATPTSGTAVNAVSVTSTNASFASLTAGTQYTILVKATDPAGTESQKTTTHTTPTSNFVSIACPKDNMITPYTAVILQDGTMAVIVKRFGASFSSNDLALLSFSSSGYGTTPLYQFTGNGTYQSFFYNATGSLYITTHLNGPSIKSISSNFIDTNTLLSTTSVIGTDYKENIYIKIRITGSYPTITTYNTITGISTPTNINFSSMFDNVNLGFYVIANSTNLFVFWILGATSIAYVSVYNVTTYSFVRTVTLMHNSLRISPPVYTNMCCDASDNIIFAASKRTASGGVTSSMIFVYSPNNSDRITLYAGTGDSVSSSVAFQSGQTPLTFAFYYISNLALNPTTSTLYITNNNLLLSIPYTPPS